MLLCLLLCLLFYSATCNGGVVPESPLSPASKCIRYLPKNAVGTPIMSIPASPFIDWKSCNVEAVCGMHACCTGVESDATIFGTHSLDNHCVSGIWIKPLSEVEWIVKMQVSNLRIDPVKGMYLNHANAKQFGCNLDKNGTIVALSGEGLEIANLAKGSTFMEYVLTTGIYDHEKSNEFENVNKMRRCDIAKATTNFKATEEGYIKHPFKDLLAAKLTCPIPAVLFAGKTVGKAEPVTEVECVESDGNWVYRIRKTATDEEDVEKDKQFEAFCAIPVKTTCKDPKYIATEEYSKPPTFEQAATASEAFLKGVSLLLMPQQQMACLVTMTDHDEKLYYTVLVTCRNSANPNEAGWFISRKGKYIELKHAACSEQYLCEINHLLTYGGKRCPVEYSLTVKQHSGSTLNMEKLACDSSTGRWKDEANRTRVIDDDAYVYCEKEESKKEAQSSKIPEIVSMSLIVLVALMMVVYIIKSIVTTGEIVCEMKRRRAVFRTLLVL